MATYAGQVSIQGRVQHEPLRRPAAIRRRKDRSALLSLLAPIQKAAESSSLAKELIESGDVYGALAWSPQEAYRFLKEIPLFEESGLVVRAVPDWWNAKRPPRPAVSVKVDGGRVSQLGAAALLDFSATAALDGEPLSEAEWEAILHSQGGLVSLKGKWVEVDPQKLSEALAHWKHVERQARHGEISFFEGMRLLAGTPLGDDTAAKLFGRDREWTTVVAEEGLDCLLRSCAKHRRRVTSNPPDSKRSCARISRPGYTGCGWSRGWASAACLADDMGLGKTVQVIGLLLHLKASGHPAAERQAASIQFAGRADFADRQLEGGTDAIWAVARDVDRTSFGIDAAFRG